VSSQAFPKPENIATILANTNAVVEYVDFSEGLESALRQTAKLVNREELADAVIARYKKDMTATLEKLPTKKSGKRVIIFNSIYQASTGRSMLRVEAPGGYSDRFLLEKTGYINAGDAFKPTDGKSEKGYFPVLKKSTGMVLDPLIVADPDVIVMTGGTFAIQKALAEYLAGHPEMRQIKAIRNLAVYDLPLYVDSSVLEYPGILQKWLVTLIP